MFPISATHLFCCTDRVQQSISERLENLYGWGPKCWCEYQLKERWNTLYRTVQYNSVQHSIVLYILFVMNNTVEYYSTSSTVQHHVWFHKILAPMDWCTQASAQQSTIQRWGGQKERSVKLGRPMYHLAFNGMFLYEYIVYHICTVMRESLLSNSFSIAIL